MNHAEILFLVGLNSQVMGAVYFLEGETVLSFHFIVSTVSQIERRKQ